MEEQKKQRQLDYAKAYYEENKQRIIEVKSKYQKEHKDIHSERTLLKRKAKRDARDEEGTNILKSIDVEKINDEKLKGQYKRLSLIFDCNKGEKTLAKIRDFKEKVNLLLSSSSGSPSVDNQV